MLVDKDLELVMEGNLACKLLIEVKLDGDIVMLDLMKVFQGVE